LNTGNKANLESVKP